MKKIGLPSFVTVRRPRGGSRPRCRLRVLRVHHVRINALRRVHGGAGPAQHHRSAAQWSPPPGRGHLHRWPQRPAPRRL